MLNNALTVTMKQLDQNQYCSHIYSKHTPENGHSMSRNDCSRGYAAELIYRNIYANTTIQL